MQEAYRGYVEVTNYIFSLKFYGHGASERGILQGRVETEDKYGEKKRKEWGEEERIGKRVKGIGKKAEQG